MLLLPGHHEFAETLANLPFFHNRMAREICEPLHVIQKNHNFVPEIATTNELLEYLLGGEAEEIVEFVDGYADDDDFEDDDLLDNWELADSWLGTI
jgi:hypothetical protein